MKSLTVLCDLDGIVVDLLSPWLASYNEAYKDKLTKDDITDWHLEKIVKPECGQKIYQFIDSGEAYRNLQPLDGALEGIKLIESMGHDVIIVSAGSKHLATAGHKLEWCQQHLGFGRKKVFIGHRKELIRGDVFIDDSPDKISDYRKSWPNTPIFTIAYPYNKKVDNLCMRAENHNDTKKAWRQIVKWVAALSIVSGPDEEEKKMFGLA